MNLKVKGCYCMSLRNACLVLGWIGLIGTIVRFITITISLSKYYSHSGGSPLTEISIYGSSKVFNPAEAYVQFVFCLFDVVVSGFMIYGVLKNKHQMLMPWLIYNTVGIGLMTYSTIVLVFLALASGQPILMLSAFLFVLGIGLYCWAWVVVNSLYKEIRDSTRRALSIDRNTAVGTVGTAPLYQECENKSYGPAYP